MNRRDLRGSATLHAVFLVGLLVTVSLAASSVGAVLVGKRQAAVAADLAALAGATAAQRGADSCGVAAQIATDNGGRLAACTDVQGTIEVEVEVAARTPAWPSVSVSARARAGPG